MLMSPTSSLLYVGTVYIYIKTVTPCPSIGPKLFWTVQIVLDWYKLLWLGPNYFGQVQIKLLCTDFYNLDLSKMIWARQKQIGPDHNDWYSTKIIWIVQRSKYLSAHVLSALHN
jgi:hypothetical protein